MTGHSDSWLTISAAKRFSRKLVRIAAAHQVLLGAASALFILAPYVAALYGSPLIPSFRSSPKLPVTVHSRNDANGPRTEFTIFDPTSESPEQTLDSAGWRKLPCADSDLFVKGAGVYRCAPVTPAGNVPMVLDPCFGIRPAEVLCAVTATRMWRLKGVVLRGGGSVITHGLSAGGQWPWRLLLDNGENCLLDWLDGGSIVKDGPRWICVLPKSLAASRRITNPDGTTLRVPTYGSPPHLSEPTDDPLDYIGALEVPIRGVVNDYVEALDYGDGSHWTVRLQIGENRAKIERHRVVKATF